jgi:hypothetical protein
MLHLKGKQLKIGRSLTAIVLEISIMRRITIIEKLFSMSGIIQCCFFCYNLRLKSISLDLYFFSNKIPTFVFRLVYTKETLILKIKPNAKVDKLTEHHNNTKNTMAWQSTPKHLGQKEDTLTEQMGAAKRARSI